MNLDAYMDDFGRDLRRAAARRRARRRLARRGLVPAGAALAVAITVLPGGGDVDAIAAARAALAPNGEIVHMKVELIAGKRVIFPVEQWYADRDRWRTRSEAVTLRGPGSTHTETAFFNNRMRLYDSRRDVVTIWRDPKLARGSKGPSLLGGDPATDLRTALGKGDVRDDGLVMVDGREVRRLVADDNDHGLKRRFVYHMDPDTFAPIGGHVRIQRPRSDRWLRGPEFKVSLYERLPLNEQTEGLLRLEKTPRTKYVWR